MSSSLVGCPLSPLSLNLPSLIAAGQHSLPVTHVSFFPARGTSAALSVDRRGRVVTHTLSSMLLRTR